MHLLKIMLKVNGRYGVPQGGVITPRTQKITSNSNARFSAGDGIIVYLTCVVNGNTYMSYDAINRCPKGRTIECCAPLAGARHRFGHCCHRAFARIWTVTPPGLSLSRGGGGDRPSSPCQRTIGTDHVQDSGQRGARSAQLFGKQRTNTRRDCSACHLDLSKGDAQAWLKAREGIARSVSIIRSIACSPTNSSMPTRSSFRTRYGSSTNV